MFEIDSERTSLPLSPDKVLALVASLNAPMVVAADMPVEPTRAYICAYRDGVDEVRFSIYLHCVESNNGAFYRYDAGRVPQARFDEVMGEAMAFAESLGFMMDDLGFRGLDAARRDELMRETPMFLEPSARATRSPAAEPPEPANTAVVDESADAGLVGATPISPIPEPAAPRSAAPAPSPPAAPSPPPAPPASTLPPAPAPSPAPGAASSSQAGATPPSPARAEAGAPQSPAPPLQTVFVAPPGYEPAHPGSAPPAAPQDSAVVESGAREIELTIDAPEPEPVVPSAPPAAPARELPGTPPGSAARPAPAAAAPAAQPAGRSPAPAREAAGARPGPARAAAATPGLAAAAQALVRVLASL